MSKAVTERHFEMGMRLDNAKALYLEAIGDGDYVAAIDKYAADPYLQHSTPVRDGKDGFIEFFSEFVERNPKRKIEIVRGFEDGQYVFLHALQTLNDGEYRYVTADIFDTNDEGKMIEHWDLIAEWVDESVSGHTQIDGATEVTDLDRTEENKTLVRDFVTDVLINGDMDKVTEYISTETYLQHNPLVGDGLEGLTAFVATLTEQGKSMVYQKIHKLVGSGNFVAVLSEMQLAGADTAVLDLFRVEDGRIVEHWDVMEEILPRDEWVNSGKF